VHRLQILYPEALQVALSTSSVSDRWSGKL